MGDTVRHNETSVLIVGAGPAGLVAALELSKWDVPVTIIDALPGPRPLHESRAGGIQPRTYELFDRYGRVTEKLASRKAGGGAKYIMYRCGEEVGRIDMTLAQSRYAGAPGAPQGIIEQILREELAELGVKVQWGRRLFAIEQDEESATAHVHGPDGDLTIKADFVLGCDGARSTLRKLLGLDFAGVSRPLVFALMDAKLDWEFPPDALRTFSNADGEHIAIVPFWDGIWRIQGGRAPDNLDDTPPTVEEMQAAFDRITGLKGKISDMAWSSAFRVNLRQVVAYRSGRVYLAGDSAHIHHPAGAQGLNTGVQDSINLGWKMGLVLQGRAGPELLATYEAERQPIAEGVLKFTDRFSREGDGMASSQEISQQRLVNSMAQLLVNYRSGPLGDAAASGGAPGPGDDALRAGDRLPEAEVDGATVYRGLRDAKVVVALFGDEAQTAAAAAKLAPFGEAVTIWRHAAGDNLAQALGLSTGAAVIRPDAYLGPVVGGAVADAVVEVADWLQSSLHLVRAPGAGAAPLADPVVTAVP